jgi:hypothetical protein
VEADVELKSVGFPGTWCCQMDDAKVLSGDGCCVRLWSHDTGRRIATLRGHTGTAGMKRTCLASAVLVLRQYSMQAWVSPAINIKHS